jgi:tryptophan-rich sensory protein
MNIHKTIKLILSILICEAAGVIGSFFTSMTVKTWYPTLNKPVFNPPSYVFGVVWVTLYALMGISLYLVWQTGLQNKKKKKAIIIFSIQLIFNVLWTAIFFGAKSITGGLIVICILLWLIILTIYKFYPISKLSAYLLIPYLLWVIFACILNAGYLRIN